MTSFYYLVNIDRSDLPGDDYQSILVAFDDEEGKGIHSKSVTGIELNNFMSNNKPIHYEEMFLTDKNPTRVVYWANSNKRGWAERVERQIHK